MTCLSCIDCLNVYCSLDVKWFSPKKTKIAKVSGKKSNITILSVCDLLVEENVQDAVYLASQVKSLRCDDDIHYRRQTKMWHYPTPFRAC